MAATNNNAAAARKPLDLTFDETIRARQFFQKHVDSHITTEFELRTTLADIGQFPSDGEIRTVLDIFDHKMSFNNFAQYLSYLKSQYLKPDPKDLDTIRAFVALGGNLDRKGTVNTRQLIKTIHDFDLTIDIDAMIREVDDDDNGTIDYGEFKSLWESRAGSKSFVKQKEVETVPAFLGGGVSFAEIAGIPAPAPTAVPNALSGGRTVGFGRSVLLADEDEPAFEEDEDVRNRALTEFLKPKPQPKPTDANSQSFIMNKRKSTKPGDRSKSVVNIPRLPPIAGATTVKDENATATGGNDDGAIAPSQQQADAEGGNNGEASAEGSSNATNTAASTTTGSTTTKGPANRTTTTTDGTQQPNTARPSDRNALVLPEPYVLGSKRFKPTSSASRIVVAPPPTQPNSARGPTRRLAGIHR